MKTLIISVGKLTREGQEPPRYPVNLYARNDKGVDELLASDFLNEDLSIAAPPLDPNDDAPLTLEKVREIAVEQKDQSDRFKAVGRYLFGVISAGKIGPKWEERRRQNQQGLRTILDVTDDLRWLPWELLFADGHWLFADPRSPFVRGQRVRVVESQTFDWPIHVLIVVGSDPSDDNDEVKAGMEIDCIRGVQRRLGVRGKLLDLAILNRPSKRRLMQMLRDFKPHVFHYIGHGSMEEGQDPVLTFKAGGRDNPDAWEWDVESIKTDLLNLDPHDLPRLAFINACHTADFASQLQAQNISDAFVRAGVPAVIGMQSDIDGEAAATFASELYLALVQGEPLDSAMAKSRSAVSSLPSITWKGRDWALAALHVTVAPEDVLPLKVDFDDAYCAEISSILEFQRIRPFVDRTYQRRTLSNGIDPVRNPTDYKGLLLLAGPEKVGKTAIVHWCLEALALRRRNFLYVDMEDERSFNFLDTLRLIAKGDDGSFLSRPLRPEAFDKFYWELNHLLKNPHVEPLAMGSRPVQDHEDPWPAGGGDRLMHRIFATFRESLKQAAGDEPLVIVLDHLNINTGDFTCLFRNLIKPIAERRLPPVRMILVLNRDDEIQFEELVSIFEPIPVLPFKKCDYVRLASDYCRYLDTVDMEKALEYIKFEDKNKIQGEWMPRDLINMRKLVLKSALRY